MLNINMMAKDFQSFTDLDVNVRKALDHYKAEFRADGIKYDILFAVDYYVMRNGERLYVGYIERSYNDLKTFYNVYGEALIKFKSEISEEEFAQAMGEYREEGIQITCSVRFRPQLSV